MTVHMSASCVHIIRQISRENRLKKRLPKSIPVSKAIEGFLKPFYNR